MVALAVDGGEGLLASDLELTATGPSYTSATLRRLHALGHRPAQLFFITGADAFAEIATWRDYPAFLDDAQFVVVSRAGRGAAGVEQAVPSLADRLVDGGDRTAVEAAADGRTHVYLVNHATPDVSATAIRARCAGGLSLEGFVPDAVARHIHRHGLYRGEGARSASTAGHHAAASHLHE
jgi:nicotinate-nucleotide adenylyltransferase